MRQRRLRRRDWLGSRLLVLVLGGCAVARPAGEPGSTAATLEPARSPMFEVQGVQRETSLLRGDAPGPHGYARGDLLGIFAEVDGKPAPVGYGHVQDVRGKAVALRPDYLSQEYRADARWLGPLPEHEHFGNRLGRVLAPTTPGLVDIDVGHADGVRLGDSYRITPSRGAHEPFEPPGPGTAALGLVQVVRANDGQDVSSSALRYGRAPIGAWVERVDDAPRADVALGGTRPITVLVLHLQDDHGGGQDDPQRQYWSALRDQLDGRPRTGDNGQLRLVVAQRTRATFGDDPTAIAALGRAEGADVVVWGRMACQTSAACARPRVTFVDWQRLDHERRQWELPMGPRSRVTPLPGAGEETTERSIRGLASWLSGLAYFHAEAYQEAAHHLEQVPLQDDLHRPWMSAQVMLARCYRMLGNSPKADTVAQRVVDHGASTGTKWFEARGRLKLPTPIGADEETLAAAERAKRLAESDGDEETVGDAWDRIGRVAASRGDRDEALRIHAEVQLPIYERLGDLRSVALTWRRIGGHLSSRGKLDEALRIHRDKELVALARVGRPSDVASTWGEIADLLFRQGEVDEALRIREHEQLPVYERLAMKRAVADTWGEIASIRFLRGELDEALRIQQQERLPRYEQLGDTQRSAQTWRAIGDVLVRRGALDEALRIRTVEELPVFEALGSVRDVAVTWGRIADVAFIRREYSEALRIRTEREFPLWERLGDAHKVAVTWAKIADILAGQGELEAALRIQRDEVLPAYERLGAVRNVAVSWGKIADIASRQGQLDYAMFLRRNRELPVYQQLGDVREEALVWLKIGNMLAKQGDVDVAISTLATKVVPVLETLGAAWDLVFARYRLARHLLARGEAGDRDRAEALLRAALQGAEAMKLPKAESIRRTMAVHGFETDAGASRQ